MMTIGNHQRVINSLFACRQRNMPLIGIIAARILDIGIEGDAPPQIEMVNIIVEVGQHLLWWGKSGQLSGTG